MIPRRDRLDRRLDVFPDPPLIRRCLMTLYRELGPAGMVEALLATTDEPDRRFAEQIVQETAWAAMA